MAVLGNHRESPKSARLVGLIILTALLFIPGSGALAHGGTIEVRVESVQPGDDGSVVDYGVSLTFADGDGVSGAQFDVTASLANSTTVPAVPEITEPFTETVSGIYIGKVRFPTPGDWRVTLAFDGPDGSGSVEFTQRVTEQAGGTPVVMVDTANPDRVGTEADGESSLTPQASPAPEPTSIPIVIEAYIADAVDPLRVEYALSVNKDDNYTVVASAQSDRGTTLPPVEMEEEAGVYRTTLVFPEAAVWTVSFEVTTSSVTETAVVTENLPWPHYTVEAGHPKVRFDSSHPDRVGTLPSDHESIYLSGPVHAGSAHPTDSTVAKDGSPSPGQPPTDVVISLPSAATELVSDIGLRLLHLFALGLWAIPLVLFAAGFRHRVVTVSAIVGMGLTVITGVLLMLFSAPISYPGVFRWSELGTHFYGPSYQIAFIVKMGAALIGASATTWWALHHGKRPIVVALTGMAGALIAVTFLGQFHLFSHLG